AAREDVRPLKTSNARSVCEGVESLAPAQVSRTQIRDDSDGSTADEAPIRTVPRLSVSAADLASKHSELMEYFNRMLRNAGRNALPSDAQISESEVRPFLDAIALSRKDVKGLVEIWD